MNYEKDIKIEDYNLDIEWLEQPEKMFKYAKNAAELRAQLDSAKENLDLVKAELDKNVRSNPDKFGIEKITEAVVTATIITHPDYKKANDMFLQSKFELDVANAAVKAMEQRKDALENLVKLFGLQYFAGPKVPRNLTSEIEKRNEKTKETNRNIGRTLTRTK